jgi:hypothetical protein
MAVKVTYVVLRVHRVVAALGDGGIGVEDVPDTERAGAWVSDAQTIQLENVVGRADQRPFPLYLLNASQ